jgi:hypothetical protein
MQPRAAFILQPQRRGTPSLSAHALPNVAYLLMPFAAQSLFQDDGDREVMAKGKAHTCAADANTYFDADDVAAAAAAARFAAVMESKFDFGEEEKEEEDGAAVAASRGSQEQPPLQEQDSDLTFGAGDALYGLHGCRFLAPFFFCRMFVMRSVSPSEIWLIFVRRVRSRHASQGDPQYPAVRPLIFQPQLHANRKSAKPLELHPRLRPTLIRTPTPTIASNRLRLLLNLAQHTTI